MAISGRGIENMMCILSFLDPLIVCSFRNENFRRGKDRELSKSVMEHNEIESGVRAHSGLTYLTLVTDAHNQRPKSVATKIV
jgi:hypothetical protein